jgi:hypothetical protein
MEASDSHFNHLLKLSRFSNIPPMAKCLSDARMVLKIYQALSRPPFLRLFLKILLLFKSLLLIRFLLAKQHIFNEKH